jgi:putative ATP-dependent endonuclease of OLD family
MRISRVTIDNFRNFASVDVGLADDAVIVGENKVGKSNFLYALRLVLDPSLPDSARQLRVDDFWDGVARPIATDARIRVTVELAGFDEDDEQLASLADFLVQAEPMVARLTYEFRHSATSSPMAPLFEFVVYGGDREEARLNWDVRRRLALEVVHALRDVEGDLASWRRSPLRPLLSKVADAVAPDDKRRIADGVADAADAILELDDVDALGRQIGTTLTQLVGPAQAADIQLGLAPSDADRLLRSLRLLLDGGTRGVGEASLGVANTIYLTLKLLELQQLAKEGARDHTFLAIEEPEAHLHPHVQRNVYRSLLRARQHLPAKNALLGDASTTILLTTHSPHVASVSPVRSLVLLRKTTRGSIAVSTAAVVLDKRDEDDLERYLDVTRAEILFARAVVLVEGDAEVFVIPRIASMIGHDLDLLGITVASVGGTNFTPHVKLLTTLGIPFAVVTDGDPGDDDESLGEARVSALLEHAMPSQEYDDAVFDDELVKRAPNHGIFLGTTTFEIDLLRSGRAVSMSRAIEQLGTTKKARERAAAWGAAKKVPATDEARFLADIETIGKGRYAQRLATTMMARTGTQDPFAQGPRYIIDALKYVVARCPPS